jgi:hypothetical protein
MKGSSFPSRTPKKSTSFPIVWPIATPIAMGIGPMTADICEAMTYASALTTGTIADTVPKPIEVSNAISSAHPNLSTG